MKYFSILFFFVYSFIFAQDSANVSKGLFKVNVLDPGITYEFGVGQNTTFYSQMSLGGSYDYDSNVGSSYSLNINAFGQLRYYYNFDKRITKGKRTKNNSANFLSVMAINSFKPFAGSSLKYYKYGNTLTVGSTWGLQRTYNGNFNIDLNLGLGAQFVKGNSNVKINPIIGFNFGWVLFENKKN